MIAVTSRKLTNNFVGLVTDVRRPDVALERTISTTSFTLWSELNFCFRWINQRRIIRIGKIVEAAG
jgi:hypothetical protein